MAARCTCQQPDRVRRVGVLMGIADDFEGQARIAVFRHTLQALGWLDGRNIQFIYRWSGGDVAHARQVEMFFANACSSTPGRIMSSFSQSSRVSNGIGCRSCWPLRGSRRRSGMRVRAPARSGGPCGAAAPRCTVPPISGLKIDLLPERVPRLHDARSDGDHVQTPPRGGAQGQSPTKLVPTLGSPRGDVIRYSDSYGRPENRR